jgi:formate hydrogenlyase subunit 4
VLGLATGAVFVAAVLGIAASQGSFQLESLVRAPVSPLRWLGIAAVLLCIPAKLHVTPFSVANAEQELYAGALTEYAGPELALWELAHGLEWVALTGLVATLAAPPSGSAWAAAAWFVGISVAVVLLLSALAAATARVTVERAVRFYWRAGAVIAVLAISASWLLGMER